LANKIKKKQFDTSEITGPAAFAKKQVSAVAPGLYNNVGTAAGKWLRYNGGILVGSGSLSTPINFGQPGETVYLVLYGTGIRNRSSLSAVSVTVGGISTVVEYAGQQGTFVGQDQINAILPRSLSGAGEVGVVVTVDGVTGICCKKYFSHIP